LWSPLASPSAHCPSLTMLANGWSAHWK
jgi:hypothetical protein